jgi:hypothetical protein
VPLAAMAISGAVVVPALAGCATHLEFSIVGEVSLGAESGVAGVRGGGAVWHLQLE